MLNVACCRGCLSKMVEIDRLKKERDRLRRENARLKEQLGRTPRTINEAPFGSSTPSSKLPVKQNSTDQNRRNMGGARQGHRGYGRPGPDSTPDATVRRVSCPPTCPDCGTPLYSMPDEDAPKFMALRPAVLDQRDNLPPQKQIWTGSAQHWASDLSAIEGFPGQPE